jgi:histidinol-phosphate aminotransferase
MIGKACKKEKLISLIKKHKRILFIIDESAIDFIKDSRIYSVIDFAQKTDNLIVLRSFSKLYGIVGLRVGFATGKTKILEKIEKIGLTFPVNGVAEYFVRELLTKRPIVNNIRKKISLHKYLIGKILAKNPNIILSKSVTNCLFFGHKNKNIFPELLKLNILALNLNGQEGIKEKNFVRLTVHSADSLFKNLSEQISKFVKRI